DVPVLAAGQTYIAEVTGFSVEQLLSGSDADGQGPTVFATIDDEQVVTECAEDNNTVVAALFNVRATDPGELFDTQAFAVVVENVNEAPSLESAQFPDALINEDYAIQVIGSDPDLGDGLLYELTAAPAGMRIDRSSGRIFWWPNPDQSGTHQFTVR